MRYEVGTPSMSLLALVYHCPEKRKLSCTMVDTDKKQYTEYVVHDELTTQTCGRILVVNKVAYIDPPRGRPLPDVSALLRGATKGHWKP